MIIRRPLMSEPAGRFYTALFSALTVLGVIGGGIYSLFKYFDARSEENRTYKLQVATAQLEAKKPFFSKHLELCAEASSAASTITTTKDVSKRRTATEDFWRLYDGPLAIVENQKVESAMVEFGRCLREKECSVPLEILSLQISHSCRDEISDDFDLHLPQLELHGKAP